MNRPSSSEYSRLIDTAAMLKEVLEAPCHAMSPEERRSLTREIVGILEEARLLARAAVPQG